MASNYKIPPTLGPETAYDSWKSEIAMWRLVTDLKPEKQALAVVLSLAGQARQKALEISVDDLNKDTGMKTLLEALDKIFLADEVDLAYAAYTRFDQFKKCDEMTMVEYINEYERLYNQCRQKHAMTLPDAVLSFKLLDSSHLSMSERRLALTAARDLQFESMKAALKRIFGNGLPKTSDSESAFYTVRQSKSNRSSRRVWKKQGGAVRDNLTVADTSDADSSGGKLKKNPTNKFGKTSRCVICQSIYHWKKDCPHQQQVYLLQQDKQDSDEECNLTLYTSLNTAEIFMIEARAAAVLDTACTKTVCGQKRLEDYQSRIGRSVASIPSQKTFRFGDGKIVKSRELVTLPARIGTTDCNISAEVVEADIPLLLSKSSLQKAGAVLDLKNNTVEMFNKPIDFELTSSGHYCVNILPETVAEHGEFSSDIIPEDEVLILEETMTTDEKRKVLVKLHWQFGHATADKLKKLLTSAGCVLSTDVCQLLQELVTQCDTCQKYKRTPPRPSVCLPLASDFNDTVAVDLHELEHGTWYLHIIDIFTRFSAGCIMKTKRASEFVTKFLRDATHVWGKNRKTGNKYSCHQLPFPSYPNLFRPTSPQLSLIATNGA